MHRRINWGLTAISIGLALYLLCFGAFTICPTSSEGNAAHQITYYLEDYAGRHNGALPRQWNELQQGMDEPVDRYCYYAMPTRRYAFLSPPLRLTSSIKGTLLLMNRSATWDDVHGNWGRYFIFQGEGGRITSAWVKEREVKAIFTAAGAALPEPDGIPERDTVKWARWTTYWWRSFFGLYALLMSYVLGRALWRVLRWDLPWHYEV